jgi:hypothetical protein
MKKVLSIIFMFMFILVSVGSIHAGCVENRGDGWKYYSDGCKDDNKEEKDPKDPYGETYTPWEGQNDSGRDKRKKCYYDQWGQKWCDWD